MPPQLKPSQEFIDQFNESVDSISNRNPQPSKLETKSAVAFTTGQKFKFPYPLDYIDAWFHSFRYEDGRSVVGYMDSENQYKEMWGYDLFDLTHA